MTEEGDPVSTKTVDAYVTGAISRNVKFDEPLESFSTGDGDLVSTSTLVNAANGLDGNLETFATLPSSNIHPDNYLTWFDINAIGGEALDTGTDGIKLVGRHDAGGNTTVYVELFDASGTRFNRISAEFTSVTQEVTLGTSGNTHNKVIGAIKVAHAASGTKNVFLNAIIIGDIGRYFEWRPPFLKVNQKLSKVEQFVIHRGYTSKEVCKSLYLPSNYIKSTTRYNANNTEALKLPYVVKSGFPFDGRTNLTVSGKLFTNVSRGAKRVPFVFAANLLRCTKEYDQKVQILSDTYSKSQAPWKRDVGSDFQSSHVLLDEHSEEVDTPPTASGRKISMLRPTNTFDAMNHLDIEHTHTGDSINPVYENDIGNEIGSYSYQDITPDPENDEHVLQGGQFDSHVYEVDRTLANFISMIIALRALVLARKWEVTTRSCSGALIVEQDEIITAFSKDKNARRKWHIIENEGRERMRQIVWVEIALNEEQFIYLAEMELKGSEKSRSTLLIIKQEFAYMEEGDFSTFLELAKIRNGWPRVSQDWKSKGIKEAARDYFDSFEHAGISHTGVNKKQPEAWAKEIEIKISELLGLPPLEEVN